MSTIEFLGALLKESGAVAFGTANAGRVPDSEWEFFSRWLEAGHHAGMTYLENFASLRRDPRILLPGARTIVSVAFNFRQPNPLKGRVATYALGRDYHVVLRKRLRAVVRAMGLPKGTWRICVDSAPVLERYWARKAGVGFRSPIHGNIVVPGAGSMVFLAEIITTLPLPETSVNFVDGSGRDFLFSDSHAAYPCPTGALLPDATVDSRLCINYLTIEHTLPLTPSQQRLVGNAFFGCDICQLACRENQGPSLPVLPELLPMDGLSDFIGGKESGFCLDSSPLKRKYK